MRPIKLKLRGFITYKNEIEIDFTKLYSKKIFVISGDTGAGKTSIFDAISFALYGDVARNIPLDRLRCDFLSKEDPYTYVNLTFEVDNKYYEIERIPRQIAKKSKIGQNIAPSVVLYDINDERVILTEKINETKDMINEIIGLDQNQFNKVMLLAQGEFQQFLNSKSDDRTKLLGDIFKTYEFKYMQEKIREKASEARNQLQFIDNDLINTIERYDDIRTLVNKDDILVYEFSKIIYDIKTENNRLKLSLDDLLNKETEKEEELKKEMTYKASMKALNDNIERFFQIKNKYDKLLDKKEYYDKLKSDFDKSSHAFNIKIYEDRLNELEEDIIINRRKLSIYQKKKDDLSLELDKLIKENEKTDQRQRQLDSLKIKLDYDIKSLASLSKHLEIKKKYLKLHEELNSQIKLKEYIELDKRNLYDNREKIEEIRNKQESNKDDRLKLTNNIIETQVKLDKINRDIIKNEHNEKLIKKIEDNKNELTKFIYNKTKLEEKREQYKKNIRLIEINKFIDEMNETGICPVCGDIHQEKFHKKDIDIIDIECIEDNLLKLNTVIAKLKTENELSYALIEEIEDKENLFINKESLNEKLNQYNILEDELIKIIEKSTKDIDIIIKENKNLSKKIEDENAQLENLIEKSKNYEDIKISYLSQKEAMKDIKKEDLLKSIDESKDNIRNLEKELTDLNDNLNSLNKYQAKLDSDIENTKILLEKESKDKDNYNKELNEKVKEKFIDLKEYKTYLLMYEDISGYEDKITAYFDNINELSIMLSNLSEYKDKEKVDIASIEQSIQKINTDLKEIGDKKTSIKIKISNIDDTLDKLNNIKIKYEMIKEESETLSKLAKIAEGTFGKVKGREKTDFETFVLTYYFDKVLHFSNIRLLNMSNGQFSMARKSVGDDQRLKSGLDIEILDANTGKKRPASTLSGGESFLASLSLALGLSDEISAENGGIKIDTLFIDEGFGTLSEDYLNNVIEQIEKLSYEDKFIGLISHVEELKDAIDAKILVNYTNDEGSFIEVVS